MTDCFIYKSDQTLYRICASGSAVEHLLAKEGVAGSIPVSRSHAGVVQWLVRQPSKLDTWVRFPSPALLVRRGNPYKIKGFRFFIFLFRRIFWVDLLLLRFTWVYSPIIRTDSTIYANASALWPLIYESFLYLLLPILA